LSSLFRWTRGLGARPQRDMSHIIFLVTSTADAPEECQKQVRQKCCALPGPLVQPVIVKNTFLDFDDGPLTRKSRRTKTEGATPCPCSSLKPLCSASATTSTLAGSVLSSPGGSSGLPPAVDEFHSRLRWQSPERIAWDNPGPCGAGSAHVSGDGVCGAEMAKARDAPPCVFEGLDEPQSATVRLEPPSATAACVLEGLDAPQMTPAPFQQLSATAACVLEGLGIPADFVPSRWTVDAQTFTGNDTSLISRPFICRVGAFGSTHPTPVASDHQSIAAENSVGPQMVLPSSHGWSDAWGAARAEGRGHSDHAAAASKPHSAAWMATQVHPFVGSGAAPGFVPKAPSLFRWTLGARKLRSNDRSAVSKTFLLSIGDAYPAGVTCKLMLDVGANVKSFAQSDGRGNVQLKCEQEFKGSIHGVVLRFLVGREGQALQPPRFVWHDFSRSALCTSVDWDFIGALDRVSKTLEVSVEVVGKASLRGSRT